MNLKEQDMLKTDNCERFLEKRIEFSRFSDDLVQETVTGRYDDGTIFFQYNTVKGEIEGWCSSWFKNGQLHEKMFYKKGKEHGIKHSWHENGIQEYVGAFKNGYKEGVHKKWNEYGQIKMLTSYRLNQKNGVERIWNDEGYLESEVEYESGLPEGLARKWYEEGKLKSIERKKFHQLSGKCLYYDREGHVEEKFYVRGREMMGWAKDVLENGTLNAGHVLRMPNAEVRRIFLEELGYERFLSQVEHQILDNDGVNELVCINCEMEDEPIVLVKVRCPSTGAFYALRVPPTMTRAKQAVAWTFGLSEEEYKPEEET